MVPAKAMLMLLRYISFLYEGNSKILIRFATDDNSEQRRESKVNFAFANVNSKFKYLFYLLGANIEFTGILNLRTGIIIPVFPIKRPH